jgi:hypothetical protein
MGTIADADGGERVDGLEESPGLATGLPSGWLASDLVAGLIAWSVVPNPWRSPRSPGCALEFRG